MAKVTQKVNLFNSRDILTVLLGVGLMYAGGYVFILLLKMVMGDLPVNVGYLLATAIMYGFYGWFVIRQSKSKSFYLTAIPSVALFAYAISSEYLTGNFIAMNDIVSWVVTPFLPSLLASFLGGFLAKRTAK